MTKTEEALRKSPINYFSDLFVTVMVVAWIISIVIMLPFCIYSTVTLGDTSIWSYFVELVSVPLTAGGSIYLLKCSIQHAIANNKGKECKMDFPRIDIEDFGVEQPMTGDSGGESEDNGEAEE